MRLKRSYALLALLVIGSSALIPSLVVPSLPASLAGAPARKAVTTHDARTPPYEPPNIKTAFYVNSSSIPSNFTTVKEGAPTTLDFRATSNVTITNVVVNMTIPAPMLAYTGKTVFTGEIAVGAPATLSVTFVAEVPTEISIGVVTTGTLSSQSAPRTFRWPVYFLVNTTDWFNVTHAAPLPGDPYGSNATRIPVSNITSPGPFMNSLSQVSGKSVQSGPSPEFTPFTVTGTLIYFDFEFGGFLPAHHAKVQVWSDDFCICDHVRGSGFTDDFGFFSISGISTTSYHLSIFPEDDAAKVGPGCPFANCDGAWFEVIFFQSNSPPGGPTLNLGTKAPNGFNEAFMLHNAQIDFQRSLTGFGFTQTWRQYTVFESGGSYTPHTNIFNPPDGVNFFPNEVSFAWGRVTLFHEYGHALMEREYNVINYPAINGPSPHFMEARSTPSFAISEGWAEFLSAAVFGGPTCGSCNNFPSDSFGNVESNTWLANSVPLTTNGNIVEGSVAAVFWDIEFRFPNECYPTGGCKMIFPGLMPFLIGANKDDNGAEFHFAHRDSMLAVFTDILNANLASATLNNLCVVFVGNGLMPSQCIGLVLPTLNSATLLLLGSMTSVAMLLHQRKRRITSAA